MEYFSSFLLSMFITIALIPILKANAIKMKTIDIPNPRKVHRLPMPKIGGIAMALGIAPSLFFAFKSHFMLATVIGSTIIFCFGVLDDIKDLGYKAKLVGQLSAAILVVTYGGVKIKFLGELLPVGTVLPDIIAIPLTVFFIVGAVNAINLSDGLDGLAGGISLLTFVAIGIFAHSAHNFFVTLMAVSIMGAIFGFLRYNTFPAEIFMGDCGSQLLGFLSAVLALQLTQGDHSLSPVLPLIFLGFPILDTLTVMVERISKRKSPFMADKNHFHHKLMKLGFYHTESVLIIYVIQSSLIAMAFLSWHQHDDWALLGFYAAFSILTLSFFLWAESKAWQVKRYDFIDQVVKKKLRVIKEEDIVIKISFLTIKILFPLLLISACWFPSKVPPRFALIGGILLISVLMVRLYNKAWVQDALAVSIYFMIPIIVYLGDPGLSIAWGLQITVVDNILFIVMVFGVILTLKFTRREKGYKATPTDFIILFLALVVPNLPNSVIQSYKIGSMVAKIIAFYFTFEVLSGELRTQTREITIVVVSILVIIGLRGVAGI